MISLSVIITLTLCNNMFFQYKNNVLTGEDIFNNDFSKI